MFQGRLVAPEITDVQALVLPHPADLHEELAYRQFELLVVVPYVVPALEEHIRLVYEYCRWLDCLRHVKQLLDVLAVLDPHVLVHDAAS